MTTPHLQDVQDAAGAAITEALQRERAGTYPRVDVSPHSSSLVMGVRGSNPRVGLLIQSHIRLLEDADLVATEKVGRARSCTLVPMPSRASALAERTKGASNG